MIRFFSQEPHLSGTCPPYRFMRMMFENCFEPPKYHISMQRIFHSMVGLGPKPNGGGLGVMSHEGEGHTALVSHSFWVLGHPGHAIHH